MSQDFGNSIGYRTEVDLRGSCECGHLAKEHGIQDGDRIVMRCAGNNRRCECTRFVVRK